MFIYQFWQGGLSASWSVGELVIGEFNSRRVGLLVSWSVGDLVVSKLVYRRVVCKALQNLQGHRINRANRVTPDYARSLILTLNLTLSLTLNLNPKALTLSGVTLLTMSVYILQ